MGKYQCGFSREPQLQRFVAYDGEIYPVDTMAQVQDVIDRCWSRPTTALAVWSLPIDETPTLDAFTGQHNGTFYDWIINQ